MRVILIMLAVGCSALNAQPNIAYNESSRLQWKYFVSSEILDDSNSTAPLRQWAFTSLVSISPKQCDAISEILDSLDEALQRSNPGVENVTSSAYRFGNTECGDGECLCEPASRRILVAKRLLEVKTLSTASELKPPLQLPHRIF